MTGPPAEDEDAVRLPDTRMIGRLAVTVPRPGPARPAAPPSDAPAEEGSEPAVRPFIVSRGRTAGGLAVEAQVLAVAGTDGDVGDAEHARIRALCTPGARSVAELGAETGLPIGVVRVLVNDLVEAGAVVVREPGPVSPAVVEHILERLHAL